MPRYDHKRCSVDMSQCAEPELRDRDGLPVEVIRPLTEYEVDIDEVGPMFRVRFPDGFESDLFEDEIIYD